jgi:hypothetical protein
MRQHGARSRFEVVIEQRQETVLAQLLRECRGLAQVGKPDNRINLITVAALDLPLNYTRAGNAPKIRIDQVCGDALVGVVLHQDRKQMQDLFDLLQVVVAEAAIVSSCQTDAIASAGAENRLDNDIIGKSLRLEFMQYRKVHRAIGLLQMSADRSLAIYNGAHRTLYDGVGLTVIVRAKVGLCDAIFPSPDKTEILWMQR